jgi:hypothetical protein
MTGERIDNSMEEIHPMTPDGHALPKVLDKAVTMELVQRYVEVERKRTKRAIFVTILFFVCVLLAILVIFLVVGSFLLKNSRKAVDIAAKVENTARMQEIELVNVKGMVGSIKNDTVKLENTIKESDSRRQRRDELLKQDLERFSKWTSSKYEKYMRELETLEARLKVMQETLAGITTLKIAQERASGNIITNTGTNVASTAGTITPAPAVEQPESAESALKVITDVSPSVTGTEYKTNIVEAEVPLQPPSRPREISVVTLPNGDKYEGEFKNGLFHGWGIYTYRNGDRYEGEFRDDMKNGRGTYQYRNGDKYIGEFKNDVKEGRGTFFFASGDKYIGEFAGDMMNGKGVMFYKNGDRYEGEFKNGMKNGNGKFIFANGDVYMGEFKNDVREGKGTYIWADGGKYIGEFKNGKRHGYGRRIYPDGSEYIGEFKEGKKHGKGICRFPSGAEVTVFFKDDKLVEK